MLKKLSLRWRLTVLSISLLTVCCIVLAVMINFSADRMANTIATLPLSPAQQLQPENQLLHPYTYSEIAPSKATQAAKQSFHLETVLVLFAVIFGGGGVTYYLSGRALEPLRNLGTQIKNKNVHNLSEDIEVPLTRDEIAELASSFNEMSHKLNDAFLMQKRFSQNAAHELRTPLTILKTKLEVFYKKEGREREEYDKLFAVMSTQTERLSGIVKDLLELTNLEELEMTEQIFLPQLLSTVKEELTELSAHKNITITLDCKPVYVRGNTGLLYRAFYNLVENAIKYNKDNGMLSIRVDQVNSRAQVEIADNGNGIPEDQKETVFEPFYRLDNSRSRAMGGAGLGLSIVKTIIDQHGGMIYIRDNVPTGCIVTVIL